MTLAELTTADLRAELRYAEAKRDAGGAATPGTAAPELERRIDAIERELRRRERHTGTGYLCGARYEGIFPCQRAAGHDGRHLHTSSADGRSVDWSDE